MIKPSAMAPPAGAPLAPVVWALTTGEAGMVSQALGVAAAIGLPVVDQRVGVRRPWRWLPGHWAAAVGLARLVGPLVGEGSPLAPPWPRVVVSCGRRGAMLALAVRRASGGRTLAVHVQDPRVPPGCFDLVCPPAHDGLTGPTVIPTLGAPHPLTPARIAAAAQDLGPVLDPIRALPTPRVAVLIGGASKVHRFGPAEADRLADDLVTFAQSQGVSLVVTTSRRTGALARQRIADRLAALGAAGRVWLWSGEGDNPYPGMLALVAATVVTEDSVTMVSEACATGHPVYTLAMPGGSSRFDRFHAAMRAAGHTRPFAGRLEDWAPPAPLDEAGRLGALIRARLDSTEPTGRETMAAAHARSAPARDYRGRSGTR